MIKIYSFALFLWFLARCVNKRKKIKKVWWKIFFPPFFVSLSFFWWCHVTVAYRIFLNFNNLKNSLKFEWSHQRYQLISWGVCVCHSCNFSYSMQRDQWQRIIIKWVIVSGLSVCAVIKKCKIAWWLASPLTLDTLNFKYLLISRIFFSSRRAKKNGNGWRGYCHRYARGTVIKCGEMTAVYLFMIAINTLKNSWEIFQLNYDEKSFDTILVFFTLNLIIFWWNIQIFKKNGNITNKSSPNHLPKNIQLFIFDFAHKRRKGKSENHHW